MNKQDKNLWLVIGIYIMFVAMTMLLVELIGWAAVVTLMIIYLIIGFITLYHRIFHMKEVKNE